MTETTSSGAGAMPPAGSPVTGTASVGATPATAPSLTLEEALKKIADLEHSQGNAKEEVERHRKKLTAYEKAEAEREAAKKAEADAQLSEIERVKKQSVETEQQAQRYKQELISARIALAAKEKGIIDPELAALAIQKSLEYDEQGMPSNVDKALDALIKQRPFLAPKPSEAPAESAPATPAQVPQVQTAPVIPAMSPPGRATITAPGTPPPGKPTRLSDVYKRP